MLSSRSAIELLEEGPEINRVLALESAELGDARGVFFESGLELEDERLAVHAGIEIRDELVPRTFVELIPDRDQKPLFLRESLGEGSLPVIHLEGQHASAQVALDRLLDLDPLAAEEGVGRGLLALDRLLLLLED